MHEEARRRTGDDEDTARVAAARALGNVTLARESARGVWLAPWLESVAQDLKYALRSLRRQPSFTIPALAILFLAIGINVAVFTFFAVFMRPWPVGDPDTIVDVRPRTSPGFSLGELEHLRASATTVSQLAAKDMQHARVRTRPDDRGDHGPIELVSAN
jgi:hypothetical protein